MIEIPNMRDGYREVVQAILRDGRKVSPRRMLTWELPSCTVRLEDPLDALPLGCGRKLNVAIAAAEAVQLIGGFSDPALLLRISPRFESFMEDDGQFWGAYGRRVSRQVLDVARKLTHDRDTRQAVISLWLPEHDNVPGKRDYPCTLSLTFQIRKDLLELHVTMRSNDVWLGFAYDVFQFTQLQATLANALNVGLGPYYHHAVSMHLYQRDLGDAGDLYASTVTAPPPLPTGFGRRKEDLFAALMRARDVGTFTGRPLRPTASEQWYISILERYQPKETS